MRPGVNPSFRVCRRLKLATVWQDGPEAPEALLLEQIGFDCLLIEGKTLKLFYDASKLHLDALLAPLADIGMTADQGRWNRIRLGWYRHTDSNIYQNARDTSSSSCAQSPLRHR